MGFKIVCDLRFGSRDLLHRLLFSKFENSGDHSGGVTPDPIPNSAVKPSSADGTTRVTVWESRSLPDLVRIPSERKFGWGFVFWGVAGLIRRMDGVLD